MKIKEKIAELSKKHIACRMHYNDINEQQKNIKYVLLDNELITVNQYKKIVDKRSVCAEKECPRCFLLGFLLGLVLATLLGLYLYHPSSTPSSELLDSYQNDIFHTQHIKTTLENGKQAEFKIAIVSQEYKWKLGSDKQLENEQDISYISTNIRQNEDFVKSKALIAVGTASEELESSSTEIEEFRAKNRGENILGMLRTHTNSSLYLLNLGVHHSTGDSITADQRRIIIISIVNIDQMHNQEIDTSLKMALNRAEGLMFDIKNYSKFDLKYQNSSATNIFDNIESKL